MHKDASTSKPNMSSYIGSMLQSRFVVPSQADEPYTSEASNQCSWCAAEFVMKGKNFILKAQSHDNEAFKQLYAECMAEGTRKRKEFGTVTYGENVDNEVLLSKYPNMHIIIKFTMKNFGHTDEFLELVPKELKDEFYTRGHQLVDPTVLMQQLTLGRFALVSRHGLSIAIIPLRNQQFLVLDSHCREVGTMTSEDTCKYIMYDDDGYKYITIVLGKINFD